MFRRKSKNEFVKIVKKGITVAVILKDNLVCYFINDYNKKKKVKIRLLTHDFIDIGVDSYDGGVEIINDIERQTEI
ncbi:hypothetical protein EPJ64_05380 [Brachyspira aalborgi]|jgi:hypothetical protein|uniref:Uncharacterized protein n=1 Tax=Brachyspira aalborgi TaxID=29522 RepID=A0A5C8CRI4_9SPIR|nr:hypothetical protein [Brachyspira aalborgi]TXJ15637.1 hypothetical protein EPJ77_05855 [Brachyspira aalborgi]TXJ19287.1 hypothetical protein EPJ64_05380 [Brachyspira aalborgi]TXJ25512.1 hypothetical protein EPJ73_06060 [Brachyspira aalborgi]TXJ34295.1 hypothetical protein EPJ71_00035 [Brachyspira aalborgi]TXJ41618.1 hypothetical protein EPJ81_00420 [Brachyspira aalborgi]